LVVPAAHAQLCDSVAGELVSGEGSVEVRRAEQAVFEPLTVGMVLCEADTVRTLASSRAAIALVNQSVLRLDADTTLRLSDVVEEAGQPSVFDLIFGALQSFSRRPREVEVNTPHMALAIRGTEFVVRVDDEGSLLAVQEGTVLASNDTGEVAVPGGEAVFAAPGEAPQPFVLVRPLDAVQWALHYPPVLALGDMPTALDALPPPGDDPAIEVQRAALLLDRGRVEEAGAALDRALARDPDNGTAVALLSVIDTAQNRPAEALANAERAVGLAPGAAAPLVALSYARQAAFDIAGAHEALVEATRAEPGNALAWARLAELELMRGRRDLAREAAERAATLDPGLARTQSVLGFANLAEIRLWPARRAFRRAIELDSSDPLARFGLGLVEIRRGDLELGRRQIELAVGLDPSNALLRSYLGKAYFEEKRDDLAAEQLALAQDLDPLDPTPYLFDAIRLQTENRPVEALRALDRSIALNDNRAVFRSRQLLDEDRAARGAAISRIYTDLGFVDRGVREASNALTLDPSNAAAHRFLSDVVVGAERREVSRVSELLQAQLLQDINVNPVQPALSETNLNIVTNGGPATPGFNEFTPLFERDQFRFNATGLLGSNNTFGGEAVASAIAGRHSFSVGAFEYDSDGFRQNFDNRTSIYNAFYQVALTPALNLQAEYRHRDTDIGDLDLVWDPDDFDAQSERDITTDTYRLGGRWSPTANSDFLGSFIYTDVADERFDVFGPDAVNQRADENGYQYELQHIYRRDRFNLVTGGAYNYVDTEELFEVVGLFDETLNDDIEQLHPYVYGTVNFPSAFTWTLGVAYDDFEQGPTEVTRVNPKLGAQWQVNDALELRAAYFGVVKPGLTTNRTLEPTQVAGFNQFFDDSSGAASTRAGIGFDWRASEAVLLGGELTMRNVSENFQTGPNSSQTTNWEEQTHRLYANWTVTERIALNTGITFDYFEADRSQLTEFTEVPEKLTTVSVPLGVNYFDPSGFFAGGTLSFVHQDLNRAGNNVSGFGEGDSSFALVDLQAGYRFPRRAGKLTLQVNNLFDQGFDYQDNSFREFGDAPSVSPFIPERQIFLYLTLNF
jgi:tetratricopeptide (TPR) repeat protein